jgi:hypothetical protein
MECCVLNGDGEFFELDPGITVQDLPTADTKHLDPRLQFEIQKAKTDVLIRYLQGRENDYKPIIRRPYTNSQTGVRVSANIQGQDILPLATETVTLFENREESAHKNE